MNLTIRQRQVLQLLAEGCSNQEIADEFGVSAHVIKFHVESLLRKFDVSSRVVLAVSAVRLGLVEFDTPPARPSGTAKLMGPSQSSWDIEAWRAQRRAGRRMDNPLASE